MTPEEKQEVFRLTQRLIETDNKVVALRAEINTLTSRVHTLEEARKVQIQLNTDQQKALTSIARVKASPFKIW